MISFHQENLTTQLQVNIVVQYIAMTICGAKIIMRLFVKRIPTILLFAIVINKKHCDLPFVTLIIINKQRGQEPDGEIVQNIFGL